MDESYAGFIDVGFLRGEGSKAIGQRPASVRPNAAAVVTWFRDLATGELAGERFLRAYWYDGAFDPSHRDYRGQRTFFDAIALTPGVQLRLGHIAEHPSKLEQPINRALENTAVSLGILPEQLLAEFGKHWTFRSERQQKGVDTLIALDMVRLAGRSVCSSAVLIAGDRDLAEAVRAAQDFGTRVLVATPNRQSVAREVAQLADDVIDISANDIQAMLPLRPASSLP